MTIIFNITLDILSEISKKSLWSIILCTKVVKKLSCNLFCKKTSLKDGRGDLRIAQPLNPETLNAFFPNWGPVSGFSG